MEFTFWDLARNLLLAAQCVVEICPHTLELRRPRSQRIGLVVVEHIAHGQCQRVQIVLDTQQLQGIFSVAIHQIILQFAQAGDLPRNVPGINNHGSQSDNQAEKQSSGRSPTKRR